MMAITPWFAVPLVMLFSAAIKVGPSLPLAIAYTNVPPCAIVESSTDLTNWFCVAKLQKCDGSTNPWQSVSWSEVADGTNQYWRIRGCTNL